MDSIIRPTCSKYIYIYIIKNSSVIFVLVVSLRKRKIKKTRSTIFKQSYVLWNPHLVNSAIFIWWWTLMIKFTCFRKISHLSRSVGFRPQLQKWSTLLRWSTLMSVCSPNGSWTISVAIIGSPIVWTSCKLKEDTSH